MLANASCGRKQLRAALAAALILSHNFAATGAWACREEAVIVFDASGSMLSMRDGRRKIDLAREAVGAVLPEVTQYRPTGLITYGGHGPPCADVFLRVPPQLNSSRRILSALRNIRPSGATPLVDAVSLAADTLKRRNAAGMIVLVTDGLELCGRNACRLADRLRHDTVRIPVHIISFYLHGHAINSITCLAGATGGTYSSTASLAGLRQALRRLLTCLKVS